MSKRRPRYRDPVAIAKAQAESVANTEAARGSVLRLLGRLDTIQGPGSAKERTELLAELDAVLGGVGKPGIQPGAAGLQPTGLGLIPGTQTPARQRLPTGKAADLFRSSREPQLNLDREGTARLASERQQQISDLFRTEARRPALLGLVPELPAVQRGGIFATDLLSRKRRGRRGRSGSARGIEAPILGSAFSVGPGTALGI